MKVEVIHLADLDYMRIQERINEVISNLEFKYDAEIVDIKYTEVLAFIHYKTH